MFRAGVQKQSCATTSAAESVTVVHILSRCIASCYISGMQPRQFVEKPVSFKVLGGLEQFFSKHLVNTALKSVRQLFNQL